MSDQNDLEKQSARDERNLRIGLAAVGVVLLAGVFSAVASVAMMENEPEPPAPPFEHTIRPPAP